MLFEFVSRLLLILSKAVQRGYIANTKSFPQAPHSQESFRRCIYHARNSDSPSALPSGRYRPCFRILTDSIIQNRVYPFLLSDS